jgi:uncharacterized protein (DUF697 family)
MSEEFNPDQSNPNKPSTPAASLTPAMLDVEKKANKIVKNHVLCAMGAGLIPIPLVDIASVTAIQVDALKSLAELHGVDASDGNMKAIVTGLAGSTLARLGASAIKLVPGIGSAVGGLTMAGLSGASTYAICHVAQNHFKTKGTFIDFNMTDAKEAYALALEKGKELVKTLEQKKDQAVAKFEEIQKLQKEKAAGKISAEDFAKKQKSVIFGEDDDEEKPS